MEPAQQQSLAIRTLTASLLIGGLGDLFIRDQDWGIGFVMIGWIIAGVMAYLYRYRIYSFRRDALALLPIVLLFASLYAWRDAIELKLLNFLSLRSCRSLCTKIQNRANIQRYDHRILLGANRTLARLNRRLRRSGQA